MYLFDSNNNNNNHKNISIIYITFINKSIMFSRIVCTKRWFVWFILWAGSVTWMALEAVCNGSCYEDVLGDMVEPRSWITWNPRTLRYGEYKNTGTGSLRKGRQLVRKRLRLLSKGLSKGLPKLDERSFPYWFGPATRSLF